MKTLESQPEIDRGIRSTSKEGKVGWALLWLMGVPIPFLALLFLLRGCD